MISTVIDSPFIQQQAHQHVLSSSAEEEVLKRTTDCVYFLASPLTCKKGSECEYRHSEMARLNIRDCWYWINTNCLNAKCAFRHPPVDGLSGTQAATSSAPTVSISQTFIKPAMYRPGPGHQILPANATYHQGKHTIPCVFFQQGFCRKGSRCTYSHCMSHVSDPLPVKRASSVPQKCSHPHTNVPKIYEDPSSANPGIKFKSHVSRASEKSNFQCTQLTEEGSCSVEEIAAPVMYGNTMNWLITVAQNEVSDDSHDDDNEFYRESSPGFDVLVDDELRDADQFRNDGYFHRRNLNVIDVDGSSNYNRAADIFHETFNDHENGYGSYYNPHGYDSYDPCMQVKNALTSHQRDSPQRNSVRSESLERRGYDYCRAGNTNSDLRQHIKQGRVKGFRIDTTTNAYIPEGTLSSRLGGRLSIPERSSIMYCSNRDFKRGTNSRNGRVSEDFNNKKRNNRRRPHTRRDNIMSDTVTDFTGPKSLAELKASKTGGIDQNEQQMEGKESFSVRKQGKIQPVNGDVIFQGPKPLIEILKRKRRAESLKEGNNHLLDVQENSYKYAKVEPVARIDGFRSSMKEPYVTEVEAENETFGDFDYEQKIDGVDYNLDYEGGEEEEYEDEYIDDEPTEDLLTRRV